jgi:uncharacterized protein YneF (UPF0154 family)
MLNVGREGMMVDTLLALAIFIVLFCLLLLSTAVGRWYALKQMKKHAVKKLPVVSVAEGAIFGFLGLLMAFTFTGAYDRLELRKVSIIQEGGLINTAYLRLDMLAPATQPDVRQIFRDYIDQEILVYKDMIHLRAIKPKWLALEKIKMQLWAQTLAATKTTNDPVATQLILPALNDMFNMAEDRFISIRIHSPPIIFVLLIGLAMISAFLAGYSTAKRKVSHSVYLLSYIAITAFTIYIIVNMEFPRVGLIRVDAFDQVLVHAREGLG